MKKHFYSHIVDTSSLILELGDMELSQEERKHLLTLIDENLHHAILEKVLSELIEEDKKIFLHHLATDNHDEVWKHLKAKITHIEDKIDSVAHELKKELQSDIEEAKKKE